MKDSITTDLNQMDFDEINDWAAGLLILSIGEGTFRDSLYTILRGVATKFYDDGWDDGRYYPDLPNEEEILETEEELEENKK